jgi:hypothetical protein
MSLHRCRVCGTDYDDGERMQFCPHEERYPSYDIPSTSPFASHKTVLGVDTTRTFEERREFAQHQQYNAVVDLGNRIIDAIERLTVAVENNSTLLMRAEHRGGYSK